MRGKHGPLFRCKSVVPVELFWANFAEFDCSLGEENGEVSGSCHSMNSNLLGDFFYRKP